MSKELLERISQKAGPEHYEEEMGESAQERAERLVVQELKRLGWKEAELFKQRKGHRKEVRIALRLRKETTMTLGWIAKRPQIEDEDAFVPSAVLAKAESACMRDEVDPKHGGAPSGRLIVALAICCSIAIFVLTTWNQSFRKRSNDIWNRISDLLPLRHRPSESAAWAEVRAGYNLKCISRILVDLANADPQEFASFPIGVALDTSDQILSPSGLLHAYTNTTEVAYTAGFGLTDDSGHLMHFMILSASQPRPGIIGVKVTVWANGPNGCNDNMLGDDVTFTSNEFFIPASK